MDKSEVKTSTIPLIFSWSSGKDSAFALHILRTDPRFEIKALFTTVTDDYNRVSMHGVREELLDIQATAIGLPIFKVRIPPMCSNKIYEERIIEALTSEAFADVEYIAFADIYLADIRAYREELLARVGKKGLFPLWGRDTRSLAREIVEAGFRAYVVCIDPRVLPRHFAGRSFDHRFLDELPDGVDPCGEKGEFHTFVWDGPGFKFPVSCRPGIVVERDGFVFCDLEPIL